MRFKKVLLVISILIIFLTVGAVQAQDVNETDVSPDFSVDDRGDAVKSYTDLYNTINNSTGPVIELTDTYKFNSSTDSSFIGGINISRNVSIVGTNGSCIDGSGLARGLFVYPNCNVILANLTIKNCFSTGDGAGLLLNKNSNIIIKNCSFENNKVYNSNGGAISGQSHVNVLILDSIFSNNTSIRESDLEWKAFKRGMGSAICVEIGSNLVLVNSTFRQNNAYLTTVLLVSYNNENSTNTSTLIVKDCLFENNTSYSSGVIYLDELGQGKIIDSIFRNNSATDSGSPIILDASNYAIVKNCLFEENSGIGGGAIHIKVFDANYRSNVSITNCTFIKNRAMEHGGAIFSKYGLVNISNCSFIENAANEYGGAIYTKLSRFNLTDSYFYNNSAPYGGAILIKDDNDDTRIDNSIFADNNASEKGGAIYSKIMEVSSSNCTYINNTSPRGQDIYGAFFGQITQDSSYFGDVKLRIKFTPVWNVTPSQDFKLTFNGTDTYKTKWLKTDSSGMLNLTVPVNLNVGNYSVSVSMLSGICYMDPVNITVVQAPGRIDADNMITAFKSGDNFEIRVFNSVTNNPVPGAKLSVEVFTGNESETYNLTCDEHGVAEFDTSKLSVGKHTVKITAHDNNTKFSKVKSKIKVKRASANITHPKKVKKPSKLKLTVLSSSNGKPLKNKEFTVKVYTGKSYKLYKLKTNSKGVLKIKTRNLALGKHRIALRLDTNSYYVNEKFDVKVV